MTGVKLVCALCARIILWAAAIQAAFAIYAEWFA